MCTGADSGIRTLSDDVGHGVIDDEVEGDFRIKLGKLADFREDYDFSRETGQIDAQPSAWAVAEGANFTDGMFDVRYSWNEPVQQR
jgi:hypothetical protein